ncbi:hypothetical protein NE865_00378 [Phthorimaea operculella]|nr:hypothetical protein NE865_00378 [Phthorimaea operculella]
MTIKLFAELTKNVHALNDLILSDIICGSVDYSEEFLAFSRHLFATKFWFMRISWANKRRYILALMDDVRSAWALSLLLKSLWNCRPKDAVLSANQHRPWSVYDQAPMDHNRTALPVTTLGQVMTNDRKWFHMLDPESQALVLCELLTIAGGPVMWEVLHKGQMIFERHRDLMMRDLLDCVVVDRKAASHLVESELKVESTTRQKSKTVLTSATSKKSHIGVKPSRMYGEMLHESEQSESTNSGRGPVLPPPSVPEVVEKARKELEESLHAWDKIIKGIRDHQKLEEVEMTYKDGSKRTIWKVDRVRPDSIETVDFIQLLPSQIAKRILLYLPKASYHDYARVNKYWAYLFEEVKAELSARVKLDADMLKLQELVLQHDFSIETFHPSGLVTAGGSMGYSMEPSSYRKAGNQSMPGFGTSERSAGGVSFHHLVVDKLKPKHTLKPKPIRKLADLTERLEQRGAADENLWHWCENALTIWKKTHPTVTKPDEGVLRFGDMHFPCPLMKQSVELPLSVPLTYDPATSAGPTKRSAKAKKFSYAPLLQAPRPWHQKRFSLWSRDFSSLYRVFKVPSYQYPTAHNS